MCVCARARVCVSMYGCVRLRGGGEREREYVCVCVRACVLAGLPGKLIAFHDCWC